MRNDCRATKDVHNGIRARARLANGNQRRQSQPRLQPQRVLQFASPGDDRAQLRSHINARDRVTLRRDPCSSTGTRAGSRIWITRPRHRRWTRPFPLRGDPRRDHTRFGPPPTNRLAAWRAGFAAAVVGEATRSEYRNPTVHTPRFGHRPGVRCGHGSAPRRGDARAMRKNRALRLHRATGRPRRVRAVGRDDGRSGGFPLGMTLSLR